MKEKRIIKEAVKNTWGRDNLGVGTIGYVYEKFSEPASGSGYSYLHNEERIYREAEPAKFAKIKALVGETFTYTEDKEIIRKVKKIARWRMKTR